MVMSVLMIFAIAVCPMFSRAENPKREFRGAWLHVIGQSQYQNLQQRSSQAVKDYIVDQLDRLRNAGCNAVIFQVRPTADAVYISDLEPWSSWLTGKRGKAPNPVWDPMEFTLNEAHKRGMEFHAWLNPYRVTSNAKEVLPADHVSNREPHRFVRYNGQILFDPAYKENRQAICDVVADIVERYDVDAIHIDDYFYPYPANGTKFNGDAASYAKFGNDMNRDDWRRHNVDMLIEQLNSTIKSRKPWVRFGVSPFGIWRNKTSDPRGSNSSGLQNYDDLYADVLLWAKNGWIDYMAPQLYWTLDMKAAPSRHLAQWWNDNANGVDIYIGQDIQRTMNTADPGNNSPNELATKMRLSRMLPNVKGNVWWHGYWLTGNYKGVADLLTNDYQSTLAIPPAYGDPGLHPQRVGKLKKSHERDGLFLSWEAPGRGDVEAETDAVRYAVYQFLPGESDDINNSSALVAVTPLTRIFLTDDPDELKGCRYVVTALDRMNRESQPVAIEL